MPESSLLIRARAAKSPKESDGVRLIESLTTAKMEVPPDRLEATEFAIGTG